jgi:hypothetical protein
VHSRFPEAQVSWFGPVPRRSLDWVAESAVVSNAPIIDIGGGASTLVDELIARGFTDVTVLDISGKVLTKVESRLGERMRFVALVAGDVTLFEPRRTYALWHDRAVFHFLIDEAGRRRYRETLLGATHVGSHVVISTFGPEGPTRCSGLVTARYDAIQLAAELGPSFELQRSSVDMHTTPAGTQQQFLHAHFIRR